VSTVNRPKINLGSFDELDTEGEEDLGGLLPRRSSPAAPATPTPIPRTTTRPADEPGPSTPTVEPGRPAPAKKRKKSDGTEKTPVSRTADTVVKPSNAHIPIELMEPLREYKARSGHSNGETIIAAIESTYPRLSEVITPKETGGSLFGARRSKAARTVTGPLTSLNYRLQAQDYEVLDRVCDELGATSRGHLITEALTLFLGGHGD